VTEAKVQEHLAKHDDITIFSGINSPGSLFPFWAGRDGTGAVFGKNDILQSTSAPLLAKKRTISVWPSLAA
jgi:hypothetical protein